MNNGTVNGSGTLTMAGTNSTTTLIAGTNNTINSNLQLTVAPATGSNNSRNIGVNNGSKLTINGVVSDAGTSNLGFVTASGAAVGGTGVLKLTNTNTFLGTLQANGGIIEYTSIADVGVACALGAQTINGVSTSSLSFGGLGGTFRYVGTNPAGHSSNRVLSNGVAVAHGAPNILDASGVGTLTFNGNPLPPTALLTFISQAVTAPTST
jgi:hypothetical protein